MKATIDGAPIEYEVSGKGPAVLLLHAFPLGLFMWDAQAEALAPTHRVIRFDARGFGGSPVGTGPLTMERIADDGAALLDHLGIERAVVGGCSMGGYAAFAFVRRHPQRLAGLVLQDTRAGADTAEAKANRAALAEKVLADSPKAAVDAFLPKLVGETTHRERPALVAHLEERILGTSPPGIANALRGLAARADSRETLPTISVPTLVLVGAEDALTPPSEGALLAAAIRGARLDVIPRAGHLANLENPGALNEALVAFLARE
ncbi:MAG TPA: alpha/beta fold hydrolase [Vicinamibacteria bacterium]|nr:alpha/beta fold hydrolase [Vicinamibacteria bacterium]